VAAPTRSALNRGAAGAVDAQAEAPGDLVHNNETTVRVAIDAVLGTRVRAEPLVDPTHCAGSSRWTEPHRLALHLPALTTLKMHEECTPLRIGHPHVKNRSHARNAATRRYDRGSCWSAPLQAGSNLAIRRRSPDREPTANRF
jgi:hypothetical protein